MINILIPSTPERAERLKTCIESIEKTANTEFKIKTYISEGEGWVKAVHKGLEELEGLTVIVGDDMTFEDNWLAILEEAYNSKFKETKDGLVQPYDEIHKGQLAVCPMADAKVLRQRIHKGYTHNFSDTELTLIMRHLGKYMYVPQAKVNHNHPILGKAENDNTYEFSRQWYDKDKELFNERMKGLQDGSIKIEE